MYLISLLANTKDQSTFFSVCFFLGGEGEGGGDGLITFTLLLNPTETEMMEHVVSFLEEKFWFNHK